LTVRTKAKEPLTI